MRPLPKRFFALALFLSFSGLLAAAAAVRGGNASPVAAGWASNHAEHVYGLPGAKAKESGTLTIDDRELVFAGKTGRSIIRLQSVYAAGAGNDRVELWGMKGRLLRMAIPNGGGLFAATFMHHRVDMFTVEYGDGTGGYHTAVFFLPANEAGRALQAITTAPIAPREPAEAACDGGPVRPSTVRVPIPEWNDANVPAAYRALVYEHLIDRLRQSPGIERVYRDGEPGCAQYSIQLTGTGFKAGSQIARASTGPVGMFVATTQMGFEMRIVDGDGQEIARDQVKATIRGESESINVSQSVAKKIAKEFVASQKQRE